MQSVVTALYCKILVILGLAFPMAEVISANVPQGYYQLFYVYLFLGSLLFLVYINVDLLRTRAREAFKEKQRAAAARRQQTVNGVGGGDHRGGSSVEGGGDAADGVGRHGSGGGGGGGGGSNNPDDLLPRPRVTYGSFYLRMGAVCECVV